MCMFALKKQFVDVYNYVMMLRSSDCCIVDRRRIPTRCCSGRAAQRRSWSSTATARSISPPAATPSDRRSCCVSAPTARPLSVTKPHPSVCLNTAVHEKSCLTVKPWLSVAERQESNEVVNDDTPCIKCGKYDQPQWVSACNVF